MKSRLPGQIKTNLILRALIVAGKSSHSALSISPDMLQGGKLRRLTVSDQYNYIGKWRIRPLSRPRQMPLR